MSYADEHKCCYECQHYVGPTENEEWDEYGTEGMCPFVGVYIDAFSSACEEFLGYDY